MAIRFHTQAVLTRGEVEYVANKISEITGCESFIGGSYSRGAERCNDADVLLAIQDEAQIPQLKQRIVDSGFIQFVEKNYMLGCYLSDSKVQRAIVDVFFSTPVSWGNAQLFVVGSRRWNDMIRWKLRSMGLHWDDIRYFTAHDNTSRICFSTEQETLDFLKTEFKVPGDR